nr:T-cell-interacting, activating receptor on myeloid cells protein 1 [Vicugna pacos]
MWNLGVHAPNSYLPDSRNFATNKPPPMPLPTPTPPSPQTLLVRSCRLCFSRSRHRPVSAFLSSDLKRRLGALRVEMDPFRPGGLCVGQGDLRRDESPPKPSLSAWPSSVALARSNVTLRCSTPTKDVNFALRKGGKVLELLQSPDSTEGQAEFHLTDLKSTNAGEYTCEYYRKGRPHISSQPSDALQLLVTGYFSKPSLQTHQRGVVTEGAEVTLQCQRPDTEIVAVMFALLKAGTPMPVQRRSPAGKETDFSLQNVSVGDTGNYSCVYYQARAPFLASHPSNHLAIRVTGKIFTSGRTRAG